jgi:ABC-type phosphate transport system permease subunit
VIFTFVIGIVLTTDFRKIGTRSLDRVRQQRLLFRWRPNAWLPDWTHRAFGVWALIWGVAEIFIIRATTRH